MLLPQLKDWAAQTGRTFTLEEFENGGKFTVSTEPPTAVGWVFDDLSGEFTPAFKFLVHDPETDEVTGSEAQIFLATATRRVQFRDGSQDMIRVPDAVIRIHENGDRALLHALNLVANQWDTLLVTRCRGCRAAAAGGPERERGAAPVLRYLGEIGLVR